VVQGFLCAGGRISLPPPLGHSRAPRMPSSLSSALDVCPRSSSAGCRSGSALVNLRRVCSGYMPFSSDPISISSWGDRRIWAGRSGGVQVGPLKPWDAGESGLRLKRTRTVDTLRIKKILRANVGDQYSKSEHRDLVAASAGKYTHEWKAKSALGKDKPSYESMQNREAPAPTSSRKSLC